MRSIWLIFGFLLLALLGLGYYLHRPAAVPVAGQAISPAPIVLVGQRSAGAPVVAPLADTPRDSIVRFALRQLGIPYLYAGSSPVSGFDCSGFLQYVYGHFGVATPHSTALLIDAGRPVLRAQAAPGDIVVFTGTAEGSTTPGHAGIVISALGETPLRFVHASSARRESGVKVSQVENSGYERRFMQVRRVLGAAAGTLLATPAKVTRTAPAASRPPAAVAALPAVTTKEVALPATPVPDKIAPIAVRPRTRRVPAPTWRAKEAATQHPKAKATAHKPAKVSAASRKAATKNKKPVRQKAIKPALKSSKVKAQPARKHKA
jgi:hypothetical protein